MKLNELKNSKLGTYLIWGDSGTGKTCFACGFPVPIYVFDFDQKISSASRFYSADSARLEAIDFDSYAKGALESPSMPFIRKLHELEDQKDSLVYKTIILDSLTTFYDRLMEAIIKANPGFKRTAPGVPTLQEYGIATSHFKGYITRLLALKANVIITAHCATNKDELTGAIKYEPLLPGKLASWLPIVFQEAYRTFTKSTQGKTEYFSQTKATYNYLARTQLPGLPDPIKSVYSSVEKFL